MNHPGVRRADLWASMKAEENRDWNNFASNFKRRLELDEAIMEEWG